MAYEFDRKDSLELGRDVVRLSMCGLSLKEIGDYYGQDPDDWAEWCELHPIVELKHAQGKARGVALAGKELLSQIEEGKINAITFYLKTQGNFTEKAPVPADVEQSTIPTTLPTDPTEAASTYRMIMEHT